jgi:hypothetical protein
MNNKIQKVIYSLCKVLRNYSKYYKIATSLIYFEGNFNVLDIIQNLLKLDLDENVRIIISFCCLNLMKHGM